MKYSRGQFTNEYYQLWQMGLLLPIQQNASVYSVKYRKNNLDEYSRITLKAVSVSDALERACYAITYASPWRPENIDLHAVYDGEENLLWIDEPFYNIVQKQNEFRGMARREFLARFGATSSAILYGLQPSVAHGIIPFGFIRKKLNLSGEQLYTTAGSYTWTVPTGVISVCTVCVGAGASGSANHGGATAGNPGGGAGALSYVNSITTNPGTSISIIVGAGGVTSANSGGVNGGSSSFNSTVCSAGGGSGSSGTTSGGGGGAGAASPNHGSGGGGVGLSGQGTNGAGGLQNDIANPYGGGGGSGGANGNNITSTSIANGFGGAYGGAGGGSSSGEKPGNGGSGAVRIIWGTGRKFPNNAV